MYHCTLHDYLSKPAYIKAFDAAADGRRGGFELHSKFWFALGTFHTGCRD